MKLYILAIITYFCLLPVMAEAKGEGTFFDLPDRNVQEIIQKVRPLLYRFKISDTEFVGKETPEQLSDPLLTQDEVELILLRGIISSTAEWCNLGWKRKSFIPFMKENRLSGKTEKQMSYIGALHGFGMGIMSKKYSEIECKKVYIQKVKPYLY